MKKQLLTSAQELTVGIPLGLSEEGAGEKTVSQSFPWGVWLHTLRAAAWGSSFSCTSSSCHLRSSWIPRSWCALPCLLPLACTNKKTSSQHLSTGILFIHQAAIWCSWLPPEGWAPGMLGSGIQRGLQSWVPQDCNKDTVINEKECEHWLWPFSQAQYRRHRLTQLEGVNWMLPQLLPEGLAFINLHPGADCNPLLWDSDRSCHYWELLRTDTAAWKKSADS